jgi:hypothetical protein
MQLLRNSSQLGYEQWCKGALPGWQLNMTLHNSLAPAGAQQPKWMVPSGQAGCLACLLAPLVFN